MRRLITLLAARCGCMINMAKLASELTITEPTVRRYIQRAVSEGASGGPPRTFGLAGELVEPVAESRPLIPAAGDCGRFLDPHGHRIGGMAARLVQIAMNARDDSALGQFWAEALGWTISSEEPGVTNLEPAGFTYPDPIAVCIDIIAVPEPKTVKNRVHVDLATTSAAHQADLVARLKDLGAAPTSTSARATCRGRSWPTRRATSSVSSPRADAEPCRPSP